MKRFSLLIVAAGLLASACQGRGAVGIEPAPSGSRSPSGSPTPTQPSPTPTEPGRTHTFEAWFALDGKLFVTKRTEPFSEAVAQLALDGLLGGPTGPEATAGVETALPRVVAADITGLANGVATVQMGDEFYQASGAMLRMRRAQVVYTLTQYSTIQRVQFLTAAGNVEGKALRRANFGALLPAILVESPLIGSKVSSPVTVSGTANVFEATVSLRILDENGKEIARTFTTATCGSGCRGDYSVSVPFSVEHQQRGTIEVFESSAQDGSPINVVAIPVILMP